MKPIHILLVEDNEGDIVLTMEALQQGKFNNSMSVARDGEEAIMYFHRKGKFVEAKHPDLILLDINLPKIDGKEVLKFIKTHPVYKTVPVIILTTSSSEADIFDCYSGYTNCYIVKPVSLHSFIEIVHSIENFWLSIVSLSNNR